MKLLFDQNLSPKLVNRLADLFPDSSHVQSVGLDCAGDDQIWEHARLNGFAVVTKDESISDVGSAVPLGQLNTSVPTDASLSNAWMSAKRARNAASTWAVLQFPNCSQITFGGLPRT